MKHPVSFPIPSAKQTVLAAAQIDASGGIHFPSNLEWGASGMTRERVIKSMAPVAETWLSNTKIALVRNDNKVIEYGILHSETVPLSSTVLEPGFKKHFEDLFGPDMVVIFPNRNTVFIFPELIGNYRDYTQLILEAWRSPAPKGSLEVFKISTTGLEAVGTFELP